MTPKDNRLRKKKDIEKVFKAGKNFKEGSLILKFLKKEEGQTGAVNVGGTFSKTVREPAGHYR